MSEPSFDDLPALFAVALPAGTASTIIDHATGEISSMYTWNIMTNPSTPIHDAPDVTKQERQAIDARTPPYDGVRTYGDLLLVREQAKKAEKPK